MFPDSAEAPGRGTRHSSAQLKAFPCHRLHSVLKHYLVFEIILKAHRIYSRYPKLPPIAINIASARHDRKGFFHVDVKHDQTPQGKLGTTNAAPIRLGNNHSCICHEYFFRYLIYLNGRYYTHYNEQYYQSAMQIHTGHILF